MLPNFSYVFLHCRVFCRTVVYSCLLSSNCCDDNKCLALQPWKVLHQRLKMHVVELSARVSLSSGLLFCNGWKPRKTGDFWIYSFSHSSGKTSVGFIEVGTQAFTEAWDLAGKKKGGEHSKKFLYLFQKNVLKIKEDTSNYWKEEILVEFSDASYLFRQLPGEPGISQIVLLWNTGVFCPFLLLNFISLNVICILTSRSFSQRHYL